jgi:hypothetical protein
VTDKERIKKLEALCATLRDAIETALLDYELCEVTIGGAAPVWRKNVRTLRRVLTKANKVL